MKDCFLFVFHRLSATCLSAVPNILKEKENEMAENKRVLIRQTLTRSSQGEVEGDDGRMGWRIMAE